MSKVFNVLIFIVFSGWVVFFPFSTCEGADPVVKITNRMLQSDFDGDGQYADFFVKGVGYAPIPIGQFVGRGAGWESMCKYTGTFPLNYPELRFEHDSPDAAGPNAYDCSSYGSNIYSLPDLLDRDMRLLRDMNANTIRTWGKVTSLLLEKAQQYGIKVIAGFWINHDTDFTFPAGDHTRQAIINDFVQYVNTYKDHPAILIWGLSNENNLHFCSFGGFCDRNEQAIGYYELVNDMALAAKSVEGDAAHPSMVISAEVTDDLKTHGHLMTDVDIIGINAYRGEGFPGFPSEHPNLFEEFDTHFPTKPMMITEFGADAWNTDGFDDEPERGFEDQIGQMNYVMSSWDEIVAYSVENGGPSIGGVVFHYSDNWNDYGQAADHADPNDPNPWISSDWSPSVLTHDHGFHDPNVFGNGIMPDNRVNPEWWGLVAVSEDPNDPDAPNVMAPRLVYDALKESFAAGSNSQQENPWKDHEHGTLVENIAWHYAMGYRFSPEVDGEVTQLGGYFNGTKTIKLFHTATGALLAETEVTSVNDWTYSDITPVPVQAGESYIVAVYLNGSGGSYRGNVGPFPQTYGNITIEASTWAKTLGDADAIPTAVLGLHMFGQADITFVTESSSSDPCEDSSCEVNAAPVLNMVGHQNVDEGKTLIFSVSATDVDDEALFFSIENAPSGASFHQIAGTRQAVFQWTPNFQQSGGYDNIRLLVQDESGETDSETIRVDVLDVNRAPVLEEIPQQQAAEGDVWRLNLFARDGDGDALTYGFLQVPPAGMSIHPETGVILWVPSSIHIGQHAVTVFVDDGRGGRHSRSFVLDVDPFQSGIQKPWSKTQNSITGGSLTKNIPWHYVMGYHFTAQKDGMITQLGGFFQGIKKVRLFRFSTGTMLAEAQVTSQNQWQFEDISPVSIEAGEMYTVAVYLDGSGGSIQSGGFQFPTVVDDITIHSSTWAITRQNAEIRPTNMNTWPMIPGQPDVVFVPDP